MTTDDEDGGRGPGPLLPPQDRLWRHPAELYGTAESVPVVRRRRGSWALVLVVLAAVVGLLSYGAVRLTPGGDAERHDAGGAAPVLDRRSADRPAPSPADPVVAIEVLRDDGTIRRGSAIRLDHHGLLITGSPAVDDAVRITIPVPDGDPVEVAVLGNDDGSHVAVLRSDRVAGMPAVLSGRPPDPDSPAHLTMGSGETVRVTITGGDVESEHPAGDHAVGSAVVGPNGTIAAIVVGVDGTRLDVVPSPGLRSSVDLLLERTAPS